MNSSRRRLTGASIAVAALLLGACSGSDDSPASDAAGEPAEEPAEEAADVPAAEPGAPGTVVGDVAGPGEFDIGAIGRDVIVEMRVVLSSDDIARTVASVRAAASTLGGGVASADVDFGDAESDEPSGYAVLVVKVPPAEADRLLAGLDATATIESISQSAQDVTEQLVDLDVRIANARESVANVRGFMERAESLTDLVTLEGELTRRQTELERLEAQQRNLTDRVALSTITIEVVPTSAVPADDEPSDGLGDALRDGWDAFASFVFLLAFVLALLTPFIALALALAAGAWLVRRGVARRGAAGRDLRSGDVAPAEPRQGDVTDDEPALAIHED